MKNDEKTKMMQICWIITSYAQQSAAKTVASNFKLQNNPKTSKHSGFFQVFGVIERVKIDRKWDRSEFDGA